jgi:drug/metabolite transporter superfamily protein YnfA
VNSSASEANLLVDVVTSTTAVSYATVKAITGANGTFNIYLVVQDNLGAWSVNVATVPLTLANTIPVAGASLSPSPIYFGQSTTVNGSTSTDVDGTVVRWKWYVNSTASEANVIANVVTSTTAVSYSTVKAITGVNGVFNVYLVVQDNDGAWSTNTATVPLTLVNTIPVAGASLAPSPIYWSQSTTLDGSTSTDVDGTVVRWKWYVNSSASEANLLANVVTSTITVSYSIVKAITGANGTFNIYLVVQDNLGAWSTNTATVPLTLSNTIPVAIISGGPNLGTLTFGQTVTFNGSTSYDSDGSVVRWKWYLTSTGSEINLLANVVSNTALVSYATIRSVSGGIGTFNVILKVQDNEGAWSVDSNVCQITLLNTPPTAVAGGPYGPLYNNQNMVFNGSASFDPDGTIVAYKWYMTTMDHPTDAHLLATGVQPTVTFAQWLAEGGTFGENIIYLIVQDSNGVWSTSSEARATYTSRPPIANANGPYGPVNMGGTVTLNSAGSSAPNGSIITYKWYLNSVDNPTDLNLLATGASPILSYNTLRTEFGGFIGTRTLLLIVQDNYGFWSPASSTTVTLNAPHASYKFVKAQQTGLYNMTISGITDLNHYAVAGWFKPSVAGNTPTLFSMGDFNTGQKDIVGLHTVGANPDRLYFQTVNGTGTYTLNTTGVNFGLNDGPLTTNPIHASPGWHHFYMEVRGRRVDLFNPSPSGRWIVVIPDGQWAYRGAWGTTVVPETDPPFPSDATHNYDYTSLGIDLLNLLQSSSGWFADVAVWGFPNINNSANTVYAPADWPAGLRVNYGELVAGVCPLTVQMAAGARLLAFWPLIENYEDYKNHYDLTCGV